MLVLAQYGLRHGVDLEINWPGRISVFPIMGGIFWAMVFDRLGHRRLLIIGLVAGDRRHGPLRPRLGQPRTGCSTLATRCKLSAPAQQTFNLRLTLGRRDL